MSKLSSASYDLNIKNDENLFIEQTNLPSQLSYIKASFFHVCIVNRKYPFKMFRTIISQGIRNINTLKLQKFTNTLRTPQIIRSFSVNLETNHRHRHQKQDHHENGSKFFIFAAGFWSLLTGTDEDSEETPEDKLIMNIKRGILNIQRGEYKKAEKMLHIALKMAQDLQHHDGITYIYDVSVVTSLPVTFQKYILGFSELSDGSW